MAPKEAQWSAVTNHRPGESTGESEPVQITQLKKGKAEDIFMDCTMNSYRKLLVHF